MPHPAIIKDNVAVITGGASGIGFAAAAAFARNGVKVCIADVDQARLADAATRLSSLTSAAHVMTFAIDVSKAESVMELERAVHERFGGTDILMNNAGIQPGSTLFGEPDNWQRIIGVNMWGIINGSRIFAPNMIARGRAGLIINTGSKQGITTPPGDPAYNVSKAGVKAFTEALQHELRNTAGCRITAHLLISASSLPALPRRAGRRSRPGRGRPSRPCISCWRGWRPAISTFCARTTTSRARSTKSACCGPRAISWRTARRCHAGTRTMRMHSRNS